MALLGFKTSQKVGRKTSINSAGFGNILTSHNWLVLFAAALFCRPRRLILAPLLPPFALNLPTVLGYSSTLNRQIWERFRMTRVSAGSPQPLAKRLSLKRHFTQMQSGTLLLAVICCYAEMYWQFYLPKEQETMFDGASESRLKCWPFKCLTFSQLPS